MSKPLLVLALICLPLLMGGACEKKPRSGGDTGALGAIDRAGSAQGPVDETPLKGIDVSSLSKEKQQLFYKLIGSLSSPCGDGHSLRDTYTSNAACKRGPFAVRLVAAMVADEGTEPLIREDYEKKYKDTPPVSVDVSKAPRVGNEDAPIKIVEFFDYQCPHCQNFKPVLDFVAHSNEGKVVEYFMMFPLEQHHGADTAAMGALAANQLGKFKEMHDLLFARSPQHSKDDVAGYAKEIGLDPAKFDAAYTAAAAQVASDKEQGNRVGVDHTPTVFFNGRLYEGPQHPKYLQMWIDEELAVNR